MRHRIAGKQLSRDSDHRRAMLRNLAAGLFEHGQIETTLPKSKAVQPFIERIITIAKKGTFNSRRRVESLLTDRKIHAWVADPAVSDARKTNPYFDLPAAEDIQFNRYGDVRKAPRLVNHVMEVVAPLFADRNGGYTRVIKIGKRRLGDGTDLVILQLVGVEEGPELSGNVSRRRQKADNRTAWYEKLRGGADAKKAAAAVAEPEAPAEEAAAAEETAPEAPAEDAGSEEAKSD